VRFVVGLYYTLIPKNVNEFKIGITFSIAATAAAVIVLFASGPLVANQQTQAQMFGRFG
jgi:hypothetical protein